MARHILRGRKSYYLLAVLTSFSLATFLVPAGLAQVVTPPITLAPTPPLKGFGSSIATGNVDGDNRLDVVVGSTQSPPNRAGKLFLYLGNKSIDSAPIELATATSEAEARLGWAIVVADLNGDGFGDIAASAILAGGGKGGVFVWFGGPGFIAAKVPDVTLSVPSTLNSSARVGWSLGAGDVNNDGFADLFAGVENASVNGQGEAGSVFVYLGSASFAGVLTTTLLPPSPQSSGTFGYSISVADVNGDGLRDVCVGAKGQNVGNVQAGQVIIFFGAPQFDATVDIIVPHPTPVAGDSFGFYVATGDVNGDGVADLVVGASQPGAGFIPQPGPGKAFVFYGSSPFNTSVDATITQSPARNGAGFGQAIALGDINGDGLADIVVGAPAATVGNISAAGQAAIILGSRTLSATPTINLVLQAAAPFTGALFGSALAVADLTGDGHADVFVGQHGLPPPQLGSGGNGVVFLYLAQ